ncbi:MAG: hypothetical protein DMG63_18400 [Acidobacteria bacterium]|nr:MAG: hypothetical protein DMG63_18400 [Acidobacteriota bacterium]
MLDRLQHLGNALEAKAAGFFVHVVAVFKAVGLEVGPEELADVVDYGFEFFQRDSVDLGQARSGGR